MEVEETPVPRAHCKKTSGRHRKPNPLSLTWRTTGGMIVGAAVLGTAAATAQASVLPFGSTPVRSAAAADLVPGLTAPGAPSGRTPGRASNDEPETTGTNAPAKRARPEQPAAKTSQKAAAKPPAKSRPTAAQAIDLARSQVGIEEDGGGETKFQDWYMATSRARETLARDGGSLSGYGDANWCDMFVSWVGEQIGFSDQVGSDAWTVAHAQWFQEHGRWGTEPRPGAIVFFAWDGGESVDDIEHVGMVIKKVDDGTIETVEGNTDNAVRIKERSTDVVVGYGYPDYRS